MKKIIFLMAVVCLFQISFAQDSTGRKGDKGLQFGFDSKTFISGATPGVAGKLWLSDRSAIKAGFSISNQSSKNEQEHNDLVHENGNTSVQLSVALEKHFLQTCKLSPYWGGLLGWQINHQKSRYESSFDQETTRTNNQYFTGLLFGVEYWLTDKITLSGTHYIKYYYRHDKEKYSNTSSDSKSEQKTTITGINSSTSKLMISVYL